MGAGRFKPNRQKGEVRRPIRGPRGNNARKVVTSKADKFGVPRPASSTSLNSEKPYADGLARKPPRRIPSEPIAPRSEAHRKRRILVVDDDLGIHAFTLPLERYFSVCTTSTMSEGLRQSIATPPDVVLLNASLPGLGSLHFFQALRAHLERCPVIVLTRHDQPGSLSELAALRISGLCQKPLQLESLIEQVHEACRVEREEPVRNIRISVHVDRGIEHISRHYTDTQLLSSSSISKAIGISASHLAHLWRIELDMTLKEYITLVRVAVAKRLLAASDQKLDAIASQLGFCDASHLSRVFQRHMGQRPGEYRIASHRLQSH